MASHRPPIRVAFSASPAWFSFRKGERKRMSRRNFKACQEIGKIVSVPLGHPLLEGQYQGYPGVLRALGSGRSLSLTRP
jgi:hypothetical protein